jgi:hypothetical protein
MKIFGLPPHTRTPCEILLSELVEVGVQRSLSPVVPTPSAPIAIAGPRTPQPRMFSGSPVQDYFVPTANPPQRYSRYKNDFEELEIVVRILYHHLSPASHFTQGKGGFGFVVKVRHKIDNKIYAGMWISFVQSGSLMIVLLVKKIRLRPGQSTGKINREVEALSQVTHPYIVRYYNSWVGEPEPDRFLKPASDSEDSYTGDTTADGVTSAQTSRSNSNQHTEIFNGSSNGSDADFFKPNLDDITTRTASGSNHSFPTILFARSSSGGNSANGSSSDEDEDEEQVGDHLGLPIDDLLGSSDHDWQLTRHRRSPQTEAPRMMFIQMVRAC